MGRDAPPEALAVGAGGKRDGAVVFRVAGGRAAVLQLAGDEEAARDLLAGVLRRAGPLTWLNVPTGDPGIAALRELGGRLVARQHEARRRSEASAVPG